MTIPTQLVLRALLFDPIQELHGMEIGDAARPSSGTVHPMLARLEGLGWVQSRWEDIDATTPGRLPRRYCRLTASGVESARAALARSFQNRRTGVSGAARPAGSHP